MMDFRDGDAETAKMRSFDLGQYPKQLHDRATKCTRVANLKLRQ